MKGNVLPPLVCLVATCCITDHGNNVPEEVGVTLEISGPGRVTGCPVDTVVRKGDTVTLYAEADDDAVFIGWDTGGFFTGNPLVLPVTGEVALHAFFARRPGNMVYIPARDSVFMMGSDDKAADAFEKPLHPVRFSYDFFIGACEVTAGEYYLIMTGDETSAMAEGTPEDSLPMANISWYDAVLYCNRRSKTEGFDTVYSYSARCEQAGACPYVLENLTINYHCFGYRLPTEAEWEYACRAGSTEEFFWGATPQEAEDYAWFFDNADNRPHPVGTRQPNRFGLFDMAGNAAEWVNDWLDLFIDSLVIDPVGPRHLTQEQFEASWERPLRGGSYRLSAPFLRSAGRKGPYDMTYAGTQIDIGFRVAMGAFSASATPPDVVVVPDSLDAAVACNKSDLIDLVGTHRIKVAFVYSAGRNRRCAYVDFDGSPVRIITCGNDSTVCQPTIAPDGRYIAWGSKDEGSSGTSMITIRSLTDTTFPVTAHLPGFLPRWWVDPASHDTFLIYTDGASLNDRPQWYREKTLRYRIAGGTVQGDADVLWSMGSYHGGLSSDGRFLGTAYPRAKLVDLLLADTNIYYFVPPWNGRADTPQVCNLSMSPSRSEPGEALFLDFGSPDASTLLGKSYGFHAVLFIANTRLFTWEHVSQWFEVPRGYDQWDFTEWTNYSGAAVGLAKTVPEDDEDAVVMINRRDSTCGTIITGKNLRDVAVWIDPADVSEADDPYRHFGKYDVPIQTGGQIPLAKKLRLFWHERERASCVAVGNSPAFFGFDPHGVTLLAALNIGWQQSSIGTSITIALNYVLPHAPRLKVIVLDLDASYFNVDCRTALPRLTGLYDSKGYELDSSNGFYRSGLPQAIVEKAAAFDDDSWSGFDESGVQLEFEAGGGWGDPIIEGRDYSIDDSIVRANIAFLGELVDSAEARNVHILAVNYPQNPGYRDTEMAGRAGPSRSTYLQLDSILHEMEQSSAWFHFYDANNLGDHDYIDDEAYDANHLNARGAGKLAGRIDSLLQVILK